VREALARFGLVIDPDAPLSSLSDVERALVVVIRALEQASATHAGLLVLDEPTSYLPRDAVEQLFITMRHVASLGFGVLFVTHRLEEIQAVTDRVTVFRDGLVVGTSPTRTLTQRDLVAQILGFSLDQLYPLPHEAEIETVLKAQNVSGAGLHDFSLELRRGEIVGLTGLLGMGHEHVPYLLFGAERADSGSLVLSQHTYDLTGMTPQRAIGAGLALLPANRLRDGGVPRATARENVSLPTLGTFFARGLLQHGRERRETRRIMDAFEVRPPALNSDFATFSGGNQQKMLLGKWFATNPLVLLLHEPTNGVDVGSKRQIFRHVRDAAQSGTAVVIASVEHEDLAHLCDRVIVFRHGRVVAELHGSSLTPERIAERSLLEESAPADGENI
jgi:ribose transport system ATP-binding protein